METNQSVDKEYYYRVAIGPNDDFYLDKFADTGASKFNIIQFVFTAAWLAYRKMYQRLSRYLACAVIIIPVLSILGSVTVFFIVGGLIESLSDVDLSNSDCGLIWTCSLCLISSVLIFGYKYKYTTNSVKFYKQHLDEKIRDAQAKSTDVEEQIVILENAGGVNIFLPCFFVLLGSIPWILHIYISLLIFEALIIYFRQ